ncbi:ankyrin [Thecamonas trahens ATCC 50062]|uniref:Ankyrin n=1 Tax=Thecamonas trahens ATCC 50062 TaxID=461836 RepID=A0A0L0DSD2_THETB|nr:ankyrin [Thecamonas trahens ATCC 50062]KNC55117.1 ankyrin [Thecamonas trahens ATCC 50062]|eukprot:XP_013753298.1 ankyrin [Thecamonas trahens ATCC 50062]
MSGKTVETVATAAALIAKCIEGDELAVKKILLSRPDLVNVCATNPRLYGSFPLHFAAQKGRSAVVAALLERGADVHAVNELGKTALHFAAAEAGSVDACKALIAAGAVVDERTGDAAGETAAHIAAKVGNSPVLDLLRASFADVTLTNGSGQSVLDVERVWRMERGYATPSSLWFTALEQGELATVAGMLYSGEVHIEARMEDFFHDVTGLLFVSLLLRDAGPEARLLIAEGANVNATDERGRTPIMYATQLGNVAVVEALLATGAVAINAQDDAGATALHLGFYYFLVPSIARALLAAGADPHIMSQGAARTTPLELAFDRAVANVGSDGSYDELWTHGVELRAAFVPYQAETPSYERALLLGSHSGDASVAAAVGARAARAAVFCITLLGMALSLPALLLGAVFSPRGLTAPLSTSLEELFLTQASQIMAPVFGLLVAGGLLYGVTVMPALAEGTSAGSALLATYLVLGLFAVLGLIFGGALCVQIARDTTLRMVERPSQSLRFNAMNVFTLSLIALQFVQLWGLTYVDGVVFPATASVESTLRSVSLGSVLVSSSSDARTAFEAAFLAAFSAILLWTLASANLALGLVADYSLHLTALFPSLGSGSVVDYYLLDVIIPLLSSGGFLPFVLALLRALKCTKVALPPAPGPFATSEHVFVLDAAPSVTCYAGDHTWYTAASLVGLLYYIPSALLLGVIFLRSYAATTDGPSSPQASGIAAFFSGGLDVKYAPVFSLIELPARALVGAVRIFYTGPPGVYLAVVGAVYAALLVATLIIKPFRDANDRDADSGPVSIRGVAARVLPASRGSLTSTSFGGMLNRALAGLYAIVLFKTAVNAWASRVSTAANPQWAPLVVEYVVLVIGVSVFVGIEVWRRVKARRTAAEAAAEAEAEAAAGTSTRATRAYIDIYGHSPIVRAGGGAETPFVRMRAPALADETDDDFAARAGGALMSSSFDEDAALTRRLELVRLPSQGGRLEDAEFMAMQQVLQEQLSVAQQERDRARAKLERARVEVARLREAAAASEATAAELTAEVALYRDDGLRKQLASTRQTLVQVGQDYEELRVELERAYAEVDTLQAQVDALSTIADLGKERGRDDGVLYHDDEVAAALEDAKMRIGALETLLEASLAERDELGRTGDELEEQLVQVKLRLAQNDAPARGTGRRAGGAGGFGL